MKDIVNVKIKFREPYRPFAPSALVGARRRASSTWPSPNGTCPRASCCSWRRFARQRASRIPAVTHVDGSARLQTVVAETNPRYHALIERFGQATGVPVLLNTSFNLRGEPIVNTPPEALSTFQRSGMDALVMGNTHRDQGRNHEGSEEPHDRRRHGRGAAAVPLDAPALVADSVRRHAALVGILVLVGQATGIAPFIYTLF